VSRWTLGVFQGAAGLPALVRKVTQSAAEARALLDGSRT
jgi:hypothetical protein